jgi:hypothetical protein
VISDPWIDRNWQPPVKYPKQRERRRLLRALGKCINGPLDGDMGQARGVVHGPAVKSGRCERCLFAEARL